MSVGASLPIHDNAILVRFNVEGIGKPQEYLARREADHPEGEWHWTTVRAAAWKFDTHDEAHTARLKHPYEPKWEPGVSHLPWALTIGDPQAEIERHERRKNREEQVEASIPRGRHVSSGEAYEALRKRGLA